MRVAIVDTYYGDFLKTLTLGNGTYQEELDKVLEMQFGTSNFYSRNLRALGWEAIDVIANYEGLQTLWRRHKHDYDHNYDGWHPQATLSAQVHAFKPDVLFMQDLSVQIPPMSGMLVAGQCSCPWPGDSKIREYDIIFTSFPHYVPRIEQLGVRAVYLPLAFEPSVLDREEIEITHAESTCREYTHGMIVDHERIHDCVFIGGVGNPSHWQAGMQVLGAVAREIPTFKWWGYGVDTLPKDSALRPKYQGQAWGREMYDILMRSKLCLNRHGEVAQGYANNMRIYEATGCGSMLLCDGAWNIGNWFLGDECEMYKFHEDAVTKIRYYLSHDHERRIIAANGQRRTLSDHTYAQRMVIVSDVLKEALVRA